LPHSIMRKGAPAKTLDYWDNIRDEDASRISPSKLGDQS
jgi:hypothetical protein